MNDDLKSAPRRIPRGAELEALMRVYGYRFTRTGGVAGAEPIRDAAAIAEAENFGWPVCETERFTPMEVFRRSVDAVSALDEDDVLRAFVAGLGSAPRGRQPLISFAWARYLSGAPIQKDDLPDCGLDTAPPAIDVTEVLLRLALGWAWNERPYLYLADLEAAVAEGLPTPAAEDRERLSALFDVIEAQSGGMSAGGLEKAVARAKILPGTDKFQRYGILIGLAEFGVLPSENAASWDRFVSRQEVAAAWAGGPRSDVPPPLSGWHGGVESARADRLLAL